MVATMSSNSFPPPGPPSLLIRAPLLVAAGWFSLGVFGEAGLPHTPPWLWGCGLAGLWLYWAVYRRRITFQPMAGLRLAALCIVLGGAWGASLERYRRELPDRVRVRLRTLAPETPLLITGYLADWPEPAVGRVTFDLEVMTLLPGESDQNRSLSNHSASWTANQAAAEPVSGRVRLTLPLTRPEHLLEWERLAFEPGELLGATVTLNRQGRYRNPGSHAVGDYLDWRGYDAQGSVITVTRRPGVRAGHGAWLRKLRRYAIHQVQRDFDARTSGLLAGVVFGSDRFLDATWAAAFRQSGTFHLLVISGSHFALVAGLVTWLLSRMTRHRWLASLGVLLAVWSYAILVGLEPPVWRAAVAVSVWQVTRLAYREPDWLNVFGACACVLLVVQPSNLFAPSFQLTFGAVLALVGVAAPLYARLRAIGAWRPTRITPYPPHAPWVVRRFAEALFWQESEFQKQMRREPVTYRLDKSPWARRLERVGRGAWNLQTGVRWVFGLLLASACIQVLLLPINLSYFNRITPGGGVATLAAELLLTVVLLATLGYFLVLGLFPLAVAPFKWLVASSVQWVVWVAEVGSQWGSWRIPHWEGWGVGIYVGFAFGCFLVVRSLHHWRPLAAPPVRPQVRPMVAGILLCIAFGWLSVSPPRAWRAPLPGWLRVTFLDVGQGDCILLEFPTGETLLVDSGGRVDYGPPRPDAFREDVVDLGERVVARCLWARGIARLDAIVATHPDADHVGSFGVLADSISIGQAWHGVARPEDTVFRRFIQGLERHGIPRQVVHAGREARLGDVKLTFLWPPAGAPPTGTNDDSLVLRVDYGGRSLLLTGDIEAASERQLVTRGAQLACDVVKAPHHGSRSSSSADFIAATQASHIVFSAPRQSPFGHPHVEVVNRYASVLPRAGQWHTGRDGAVTFETDGQVLRVYSHVPENP